MCYIFVTFIQTMKSTGTLWCGAIKTCGFKVHIGFFFNISREVKKLRPKFIIRLKRKCLSLDKIISIPNSDEKIVFIFYLQHVCFFFCIDTVIAFFKDMYI